MKQIVTYFFMFLVVGSIIFLLVQPEYKSILYLARAILWQDSDVGDYKRFAYRAIDKGEMPYVFPSDLKEGYIHSLLEGVSYKSNGEYKEIGNAGEFFVSTETTAFIVIKDGVLIYEDYFNGSQRDSIHTSFSVAKSFVSFLVGKSLEDGFIGSLDDSITLYLPELTDTRFEKITIGHLLQMSSGIHYREGLLTMGDDAKTYYSPNLRELALRETRVISSPGQYFWYNNYNPLLLGMALERSTGMSIADYVSKTLWIPLGMEYEASWSIDSKKHGFEKMESGLNACSIDYAKFGQLYLNQGMWQGNQIIGENWVWKSTAPNHVYRDEYYREYPDFAFLWEDQGYYQYMWWGYEENDICDFFAHGKHGQVIFISPAQNAVMVRNGKTTGNVDWWPEILATLAGRLGH